MLTINLTTEQMTQLSKATTNEIIVTLTWEQYKEIKKSFPELENRTMTITIARGEIPASFVPGGAALSAAISGIGRNKEAIASLSESAGG